MLRVSLSHDIDRVVKSHQYITRPIRSVLHRDWRSVYKQFKSLADKHPYWGFDQLMSIEDHYKVRSTIFFLNESINLNPLDVSTYQLAMGRYKIDSKGIVDIIRTLDSNGWEIGVHGSYKSFQSQALLISEKHTLENIVKHEIIGIRQHYAQLSPDTWSLQANAGFKYDSSLGFTDAIGFKDDQYVPFFPIESDFMEIPLVIMDMCFVGDKDKWSKLNTTMDLCEERGGVLVINFHQHVFYDIDFPGYRDDYIGLIERCIERGARFVTLAEVYEAEMAKSLGSGTF